MFSHKASLVTFFWSHPAGGNANCCNCLEGNSATVRKVTFPFSFGLGYVISSFTPMLGFQRHKSTKLLLFYCLGLQSIGDLSSTHYSASVAGPGESGNSAAVNSMEEGQGGQGEARGHIMK